MELNFGRMISSEGSNSSNSQQNFVRISSQDSKPTSSSQISGVVPMFDDQTGGGVEGGRSQARFQEFVSRSRHLEIMETLHDIKNRVSKLEETATYNQKKTLEAIAVCVRRYDTHTVQILNSTSQAHQQNTDALRDIDQKLTKCDKNIQEVATMYTSRAKLDVFDLNTPDSDDGVSFTQYMACKKSRKEESPQKSKGLKEKFLDHLSDFEDMTDSESKNSLQKSKDQFTESFPEDSCMTEPIPY